MPLDLPKINLNLSSAYASYLKFIKKYSDQVWLYNSLYDTRVISLNLQKWQFFISVVPLVSLGQMFSDFFAKFFFLILHRHISKFVNISLMNLQLSPLFTLTVSYEHKGSSCS